ncbi:MAG TPA: glycoside hydrolase family 15 protein [Candidatus Binataceae bacterium]|nr:glycoside hydrolase family 15 protein [Candidatus Binataceae bacterium]
MATIDEAPKAFGAPGIAPRWTRSAKDVIGTAYSSISRVWFTLSKGVLNEIYYPTIDQPQVRDLQFLISDGETFFNEERRHLIATTDYLASHGLGVRVVSEDPEGRYRIVKEIVTDPHQPCVLLKVMLEGDPALLNRLHLYVLLAPHLGVGGWGNNGNVGRIVGREFLTAHKRDTWLALAATSPFVKRSCGYVGTTDGWQDLSEDFRLGYEFAAAPDGNIALTGEIDLSYGHTFTLGLAFGRSLHRAVTALFQSLGVPFEDQRQRFLEQWDRASRHLIPLARWSGDGGALYRRSNELLLAHEDKTYPGAIIASLSIPWGEVRGDEDLGGYHLVWTRDMVASATGLLASGDTSTPARALVYLACSQRPDGGFAQNFWINGEPYWQGIQLDEVSAPIILAWRLHKAGALLNFDPYPMVRAAARYLIRHGPATPQERWEENSGYSPSTMAANIAALICAACFAREHGDLKTAEFLEESADFLESHIERWTVTNRGFLVPGIKRHYVRINPLDLSIPDPHEDPDQGTVRILNRPPGMQIDFPAAEIVDAGFLELVRYGIRRPGDTLIEDSLRVVDAVLKVDLPQGPCWRRYTHDGYGQCDDGGPFIHWGRGRPWPLLTGERGHYELAAGRDPVAYLNVMERSASVNRLLPEQVWDQPDIPSQLLYLGCQTGSATPLMWAHAEYIKLLRSVADGRVFDLIPEVAERYLRPRRRQTVEVWKMMRHRVRAIRAPARLRIQSHRPFSLHWTKDEWQHAADTMSTPTPIAIDYVDIQVGAADRAPIRFTFRWRDTGEWEGRDFAVEVNH